MQALAHEDSSSDSSVLLRRGPKSIPLGRGLSSLAVANTAKLPSRWVLNLRACTSLAVRRVPPYLAFGPRPNVPPQRSLSGHRRPGLLLTRSLFVTLRKLGQLLQHIPSWTSPRPGLYWSQTQIYQAVGPYAAAPRESSPSNRRPGLRLSGLHPFDAPYRTQLGYFRESQRTVPSVPSQPDSSEDRRSDSPSTSPANLQEGDNTTIAPADHYKRKPWTQAEQRLALVRQRSWLAACHVVRLRTAS